MDAKLITNDSGSFTIGITNGDLTPEDGFDTAINLSLFSDARANEDQVTVPENRRGWMADLVSPVTDRLFGSLLWLLNQRRNNQDTLNQSINSAQLALNWFVDDGLAIQIEVSGEIIPRSGIRLTIIITSVSGNVSTHYVNLWENTGI